MTTLGVVGVSSAQMSSFSHLDSAPKQRSVNKVKNKQRFMKLCFVEVLLNQLGMMKQAGCFIRSSLQVCLKYNALISIVYFESIYGNFVKVTFFIKTHKI